VKRQEDKKRHCSNFYSSTAAKFSFLRARVKFLSGTEILPRKRVKFLALQ